MARHSLPEIKVFNLKAKPAYAKASAGKGGESGITNSDPIKRWLKPNQCHSLCSFSFLFLRYCSGKPDNAPKQKCTALAGALIWFAESQGFEPWFRFTSKNGFRDRPVQPLRQLSLD
jgi:hypothetical protein